VISLHCKGRAGAIAAYLEQGGSGTGWIWNRVDLEQGGSGTGWAALWKTIQTES